MGFRQILGPQVSGRDLAAQDPTAPPSLWLPLPQGQGWVRGVCQACSAACQGRLGHSLQALISVSSRALCPNPRVPPFSWALGPWGGKETAPSRAKDGEPCLGRGAGAGALLCALPAPGRGVWREGWNFNAVVFDPVTFPLGRVSPPLPLLRMCANAPLPHPARGGCRPV